MPHHAIYCIDQAPGRDSKRLVGWCIASRPIESIEIESANGRQSLSYGLPRPDVAVAYDRYPGAARSGFELELPETDLSDDGVACRVTVREAFRSKSYPLKLVPSSNGVQQVLLREHGFSGYSPESLEESLRRSLGKRPGLTLRLDLINKCNLRCIMCRYSDPEVFGQPTKKVHPDHFRSLFENLGKDVRTVVLSCEDEPLASNYFPDILSYLADEHPHVDIEFCTNAMLMNARIRNLIVEKGVGHLMLSMDGATKATLESIRVGAKYERIVANIKAMHELKKSAGARYPILVMDFVMMRRNIHEAPAFVELAARMGVQMIDFRHVIPGYMNDPDELLTHHRPRYNFYRQRLLEVARRVGIDVTVPPLFETPETFSVDEEAEVSLEEFEAVAPSPAKGETPTPRRFPKGFRSRHARGTAAEEFKATYCERPFSEVMISDQDLVRPCPWYQGHLGKLSDGQTLAEIFYGPEAVALRQNMLLPEGDPGCQGCPLKAEYLVSEVRDMTGSYSRFGTLGMLVKRGLKFLRPEQARG